MINEQGHTLPDFVIIGAQKCGTTALRINLCAHKAIAMADRELHFFNEQKKWAQGLEWYSQHFPKTDLLQGEKSPDYLHGLQVPERMSKTLPQAKLIVLLRDPITRAYSQWNQMMQKIDKTASRGWEFVSFEEAISRALDGTSPYDRLLSKSEYIDQILRFAQFYPPHQMYIGIQERFFDNGEFELARLFDFLEVEELSLESKKRHVRSYDSDIGAGVENELFRYFSPFNHRLFEFIGENIPEWGHA